MSSLRLRAFAAGALVILAIAVPAVRIDASDLGACSLRPSEGDNPENLGAILEDADALTPNDVWVVGTHASGSAGSPWAEHWDGESWQPTPVVVPKASGMTALYGVKAFAPDDVWAVGTFTGDDPLVEHWDGTSWTEVRTPAIRGTERILTAIDGTGPDDLWIVGERRDGGREHGSILHRAGDGWQVVPPPPEAAVLHGVTIVDGAPVVAGWSIGADGYARGLVASATPQGTWTTADVGEAGENTFLLSVSRDPAGAVWAVGFSNRSPDSDTLRTYRGSGTSWTAVPVDAQQGPARLLDVASGEAGTIAVGQTMVNGVNHALVLRALGDAWTTMPSGSASDAPDTLSGVAVVGADVWAVGRSVVTGGTYGAPVGRIYSCG